MLEEPKIKKVDKRDKQLPQNFEQLIEMYDVEKIWPYIKRTIDYINNDLEKVAVSPTEPTTGEKVWIQKGKNLSKIDKIERISGTGGINIIKLEVKENTSYTISAIKTRRDGATITNKYVYGIGAIKAYDVLGNELENLSRENAFSLETGSKSFDFTITTPLNCTYISIDFCNNNGDPNVNTDVTNIQVEEGKVATEYEAYVEKAIYVKNDNGVYEEFVNIEKANNQQNYSTEEQVIGTWIDGKPLYRKVFEILTPTVETSGLSAHYREFDISSLNVKFGRVKEAYLVDNLYLYTMPFTNSSGAIITAYFAHYNNMITIRSNANYWNDLTCLVVFEYTKTTD